MAPPKAKGWLRRTELDQFVHLSCQLMTAQCGCSAGFAVHRCSAANALCKQSKPSIALRAISMHLKYLQRFELNEFSSPDLIFVSCYCPMILVSIVETIFERFAFLFQRISDEAERVGVYFAIRISLKQPQLCELRRLTSDS